MADGRGRQTLVRGEVRREHDGFLGTGPAPQWTDPGLLPARYSAANSRRPSIVRPALSLVPNPAANAPDLAPGGTDGTGPYVSSEQ